MFKLYGERKEFFQWDLNQKIIVEDSSITEVHFWNGIEECALVCEVYEENGKRLANVPNILLQERLSIRVYAYCGDCYTKDYKLYKVTPREKPADYVYTETEIKSYAKLEERIAKLEQQPTGTSEKKFEKIATVTVTPDTDGSLPVYILIDTDDNGEPFYIKDFFMLFESPYTNLGFLRIEGEEDKEIKVRSGYCVLTGTADVAQKYPIWYNDYGIYGVLFINGAGVKSQWKLGESSNSGGTTSTYAREPQVVINKGINSIKLTPSNKGYADVGVNANTKVELWGVRV